MLAKNDQIEQN